MNHTQVTAYLIIPMPNNFESYDADYYHDLQYSTIDELCGLSKSIEYPFPQEYKASNFIISLLDRNRFPEFIDYFSPYGISKSRLDLCEILTISIDVLIPDSEVNVIRVDPKPLNFEENLSLHRFIVRESFRDITCNLVILANLAKVGSLELLHGIVIQDQELSGTISGMSARALRMMREYITSTGWPKLHNFTILKVWEWSTKHKNLWEGFSDNKISRAFNALSYCFSDAKNVESEFMLLFWSLVGIEALYTEGSGNLMQQLREKSQAFLGSPTAFKKKITQMYNYRSKFLHGKVNFGSAHVAGKLDNFVERETEFFDSIWLAEGILVATFQELIKRDWHTLSFQYTVNAQT